MTGLPQDLPLERDLSAACARGDGERIKQLLVSHDVSQLLQSAGQAFLVAAASGTEIPATVVAAIADQLDARDWPGDAQLARLVRGEPVAAAEAGTVVSVNLEEVADLLQGDTNLSYGGYIDLQLGHVWPSCVLIAEPDLAPDVDEDPDRYLFVPNEGSRGAWQDMSGFIQTVADPMVQARLSDAISGRGAFSRFRQALDHEQDLRRNWRIFESERRVGRARAWLADAGYTVSVSTSAHEPLPVPTAST